MTAILALGPSRNPESRRLEQEILDRFSALDGIRVIAVPHLYDLPAGGAVFGELTRIEGDLVVMAWLYERAIRWTLDRHAVRGAVGEPWFIAAGEPDGSRAPSDVTGDPKEPDPASSGDSAAESGSGDKPRVVNDRPTPTRTIYCADLRRSPRAEDYLESVARLLERGAPSDPRPMPVESASGDPRSDPVDRPASTAASRGPVAPPSIDEPPSRRWYPVIDFSRCTNCMECIDFCLFGVYGVDGHDTILVEQPDNCRKGCPACSRICPENAILFPQHKTPAIAGSDDPAVAIAKLDLSRLFGAPGAADTAARERDAYLVAAGRDAVGSRSPTGDRAAETRREPAVEIVPARSGDALDQLIDQLDALDQ
ncbi:MAG: ferredoxin family protein [Planctomycetes bacterium]|nr:ferredoxin family protein [Planctomycetota bacterium]